MLQRSLLTNEGNASRNFGLVLRVVSTEESDKGLLLIEDSLVEKAEQDDEISNERNGILKRDLSA